MEIAAELSGPMNEKTAPTVAMLHVLNYLESVFVELIRGVVYVLRHLLYAL